jgi:hypothetical protein
MRRHTERAPTEASRHETHKAKRALWAGRPFALDAHAATGSSHASEAVYLNPEFVPGRPAPVATIGRDGW